jgi:hypothetical protein
MGVQGIDRWALLAKICKRPYQLNHGKRSQVAIQFAIQETFFSKVCINHEGLKMSLSTLALAEALDQNCSNIRVVHLDILRI